MRREPTAIYIGKHKVGYRGEKDGVRGFVYKKGEELLFLSCDMLLQDIYKGPYEIIELGDNLEGQ